VRRHIIQFAGSGFWSIASVTGTNLRFPSWARTPVLLISISATSASITGNRFMVFLLAGG